MSQQINKVHELDINITAQSRTNVVTNTDFFTMDVETAKKIINFTSEGEPLDLSSATVLLGFEFVSANASKIIDSKDGSITIEDAANGRCSVVLPNHFYAYSGQVLIHTYILFNDGRSLDAGIIVTNFTESWLDQELEDMEFFYIKRFEDLKGMMDIRAEQILTELTDRVNALDTTIKDRNQVLENTMTDLENKMINAKSDLEARMADANNQIDNILVDVNNAGLVTRSELMVSSGTVHVLPAGAGTVETGEGVFTNRSLEGRSLTNLWSDNRADFAHISPLVTFAGNTVRTDPSRDFANMGRHSLRSTLFKPNTQYTFVLDITTLENSRWQTLTEAISIVDVGRTISTTGRHVFVMTTQANFDGRNRLTIGAAGVDQTQASWIEYDISIFEGDWTHLVGSLNHTPPRQITSVVSPTIHSIGENLFDGELRRGTIVAATGVLQANSAQQRSTNPVAVFGGERIFLWHNGVENGWVGVNQYDSNLVHLTGTRQTGGGGDAGMVLDARARFIRFLVPDVTATTATVSYRRRLSLPTSHESSLAQPRYIDTNETIKPVLELRSINYGENSLVADEITETEYIQRIIEPNIANPPLSSIQLNTAGDRLFFQFNPGNPSAGESGDTRSVVCNKLPTRHIATIASTFGVSIHNNFSILRVAIPWTKDLPTESELRQYLINNDYRFLVPLATPIRRKLADWTLPSHRPVTNITTRSGVVNPSLNFTVKSALGERARRLEQRDVKHINSDMHINPVERDDWNSRVTQEEMIQALEDINFDSVNLATAAPLTDQATAETGTSQNVAREDHRHGFTYPYGNRPIVTITNFNTFDPTTLNLTLGEDVRFQAPPTATGAPWAGSTTSGFITAITPNHHRLVALRSTGTTDGFAVRAYYPAPANWMFPLRRDQLATAAPLPDQATAAAGISDDVARQDHRHGYPVELTPRGKLSNTAGGAGIHIKTDITPAAAGNVVCRLTGDLEQHNRPIDTQIAFHHNAAGVVTGSTATMLNSGVDLPTFNVFIDTDNTMSIYMPMFHQRSFISASVTWGGTNTAHQTAAQINRVTNIIQVTTPITSGSNFFTCPIGQVFNTGVGPATTRLVSRFIATEDGNDTRRGNTRAESCRTINQAMALTGNSSSGVILTINRTIATHPAAYDASVNYAVGALCTNGGFVWERVTAGTGTTPALAATVWRIVPETSTTLQTGCTWRGEYSTANSTTYAVGDVVTFATGEAANPIMTYICLIAIAGNNNLHTQPSGTLLPSRNWAAIGSFNPVIPQSVVISDCTSLQIASSAPLLDTIILGNLDVRRNSIITINCRLRVALSFNYGHCGSLHAVEVLSANDITGHHCGVAHFSTTIHASFITNTGSGKVAFRGTATVVTDNPTRVAVSARNTEIIFSGVAILVGNNRGASAAGNVAAPNTAHAILPNEGGKIAFNSAGTATANSNVTISGFGGAAINASFGGVVEFNCRTLTVNRDAPNMLPQMAGNLALRAETTGTIIRGRNCQTINRNNAIDSFIANGKFVDLTTIALALATVAPLADQTTATVGVSETTARQDHRHPFTYPYGNRPLQSITDFNADPRLNPVFGALINGEEARFIFNAPVEGDAWSNNAGGVGVMQRISGTRFRLWAFRSVALEAGDNVAWRTYDATNGWLAWQYPARRDQLDAHTDARNNPHGVTLAQVGAAAASHAHTIANVTGLQAHIDVLTAAQHHRLTSNDGSALFASGSINDLLTPGIYNITSGITDRPSWMPTGVCIVTRLNATNGWHQIFYGTAEPVISAFRYRTGDTWRRWQRVTTTDG